MQRTLISPFVILSLWVGLAYTLGGPQRTRSAAFTTAKELASINTWGIAFLAVAGVMAIAWVLDRREALAGALLIGGAMYLWWASLFAQSALTDERASVNGPGLYLFIAFMHFVATWRIWVYHR